MRAVNLLTYDVGVPTRRLPAIPKPPPAVGVGLVAGLLLLALGVAYLSASRTAADRERDLAAVKAEERAVVARMEGAKTEQALADREQRDAALAAALERRVAWDQLLRDIARVLPAQTSVTNLTLQATPAGAAAAVTAGAGSAPDGLLLSGLTFTQSTVALVLDRLELVPQLTDVQLQSSTKTTVGRRAGRQFTIVAGISSEGAPQ